MPPIDEVLAAVDLRTGKQAARLLERALERCRKSAPAGIAVFDLDSTLLNNRPRQARILQEFGAHRGVEALERATAEHWVSWDYRVAMTNAGLTAESVESLVEDYRSYWHERFFTSDYCALDTPIIGAPMYLQAVRDTNIRIFYVTGRHEGMRDGTLASFANAGFPMPDGDGIRLVMKPTLEEHDDDYKARTHAALRDTGKVAVVFDNEPTHVNDYRASFEDAMIIHLATDHSMRKVMVAKGIPSIPDFSAYASR